jgi:hypothetical protein
MAGRSDFFGKLPRVIKRLVTMGKAHGHVTNDGEVRKLFVAAHKIHKDYKNKKRSLEIRDSDSAE